ncbi:MAG: hypothetical protein ACRDIB_20695, partial [Ardenticatenaceae bacterium]
LAPLTEQEQRMWEALNYGVALLGLAGVGLVWRVRRRNEEPMELVPPTGPSAGTTAAGPMVSGQ